MVVNVIWEYIYRIQREVNWQKIFKMVRRAGRRQETTNMRPKVIIRASKVIIEVGAYDELPSDVFNLPDESEYRCCLADMVPAGWLKRGGVCDKGVNTDPIRREVDLQKMFKTERQAGRRQQKTNTRPYKNSQLVRAKVFKSQPRSLVEAVCTVHQLESAHKACPVVASVEKKKSVNVVSASADSENLLSEISELEELALFLYSKQKWTIATKGITNALCSDPKGPINCSQELTIWRYNNQQLHKSGC